MTTSTQISSEFGSERWLVRNLSLIALVVLANLLFQWRMDAFGILRDSHGRQLTTSNHEPKAKFLLSEAYVPNNFNALIIGTSASVNWRPNRLTGYRFYNESIEGGNATEERKIVEQTLKQGHFKVALVALYPRITQGHGLPDGLDMTSRAEALGSLNEFFTELETAQQRFGYKQQEYFPDGSHELPQHTPVPPQPSEPKLNISQDKQSIEDYRTLIQELVTRGTHIIYVVYPLYGPYSDYSKVEIAAYLNRTALDLPAAPIINLNAPEYASFRNDSSNFIDDVHLSRAGSERATDLINEQMHRLLND